MKSAKRRPDRKRMTFESLENRCLLTAAPNPFDLSTLVTDVTATVLDGTLRITGDDTANEIRIKKSRTDQLLYIEGLNNTTINGQQQVTFNRSLDPFGQVVVETGRGGDVVVVEYDSAYDDSTHPDFSINTGSGRDSVDLQLTGNNSFRHVFRVNTAGGADHLIVQGSSPDAFVFADMGRGDDRVELRGGLPGIVANLGEGNDVLQGDPTSPYQAYGEYDGGPGFDRLFEPGYFSPTATFAGFEEEIDFLETGGFVGGDVTTEIVFDDDIGHILVVKGKDHFDHDLRLSSMTEGQVTLESFGYDATINGSAASASFADIDRVKLVLGSGTDTVLADGLLLDEKLIVKTGLGDDNVQIVGGQLGKLKIDTGGGDDTVLLDSLEVDRRTKVATGWGDDDVTIRDSIFARKVILEGGLDDDTLHLLGVNLFSKGLDDDFENVF